MFILIPGEKPAAISGYMPLGRSSIFRWVAVAETGKSPLTH
jgi:hypothetical protein